MASDNAAWVLEEFVDSLVLELDKTRETLAVKSINKPLSYTVKELSIDLNAFPSYDGDAVKFVTAQPGQQGASKLTIQLGSITDQQVRATSKMPGAKNDLKIDQIKVPATTKKKLHKLGINSVDDLKQIQRKNVDLNKVSDDEIDYSSLANEIEKSQRGLNPPLVKGVSLSTADPLGPCLSLSGSNLAVNPRFEPVAVVNGTLAQVMAHDANQIRIRLGPEHAIGTHNAVVLTVDPFAIIKLNVKAKP